MPPLRERIEEIPILAQHFMRKAAAKFDYDPLPISPALMRALTGHTWPGNLRELENTIKRYLVLADELAIMNELSAMRNPASSAPNVDSVGDSANLKSFVRTVAGNVESAAIAQSLAGRGWNRKATASDLQISYKALLYKIKRYNLQPPEKQSSYEHA